MFGRIQNKPTLFPAFDFEIGLLEQISLIDNLTVFIQISGRPFFVVTIFWIFATDFPDTIILVTTRNLIKIVGGRISRKIWFESCTSFRSFISAPFMDVITTISTSEEKSKQIIEIIVNKDNLFSSLNLSQSLPQTCSGSPKKTVTNIARGGSGIIIFFKFMGVRINSSGCRIHFNSY